MKKKLIILYMKFLKQDAMKETPVKQELKMDWENRRPEENSPQIPRTAEEHACGNSPSVITARRHVRTITTTGHIETVVEPEPGSPESNSSSLQHHQQHVIHHQHHRDTTTQQQQHEQQQQRRYQEDSQQQQQHHYTPISQSNSPDDQHRSNNNEHHHVVYTTTTNSNNNVTVTAEGNEQTMSLVVKESPR